MTWRSSKRMKTYCLSHAFVQSPRSKVQGRLDAGVPSPARQAGEGASGVRGWDLGPWTWDLGLGTLDPGYSRERGVGTRPARAQATGANAWLVAGAVSPRAAAARAA